MEETQQDYSAIRMSLWNTAMGFTNRLNGLLNICAESSMKLDSFSWFHALKAVNRELDAYMTHEQKSLLKNRFIEANNLLTTARYKKNKFYNQADSSVYDALDEIEKVLREVAHKSELLIPMKKSVADSLRNL